MNIKKNIAISETGFVFDPSTGDSFSLNPIGLEIIKLIKEKCVEKKIIETICKQYDIEEHAFEKDLYDFFGMLSKLKLIENDEKKN
jgi:hypothetical protein